MKLKFILYLIFIVSLSTLTGFNEWISESIFNWQLFLGIILLFIANLYLYRFYLKISKNKKSEITKGLFVSSLIGLIVIILILQGDYSYEKIISPYAIETGSNLYYYLIFAYLFIAIICFIVDSFFNAEYKGDKKIRILWGSILFYGVNYILSFGLAIILAILKGLSFT